MEFLFVLSGIACMIASAIHAYKKNKFTPVQALCVQVFRWEHDLIPRVKCVYRYRYHGQYYEHSDKYYYFHFPKMKVNATYTLYVNADDPYECVTPSDQAVTRDLMILAGLLLMSPWLFS